jgi:chitin disaccharide deacetylase
MSAQVSAASSRRLIVNADDFGLSPGVNRGIIEAHERGIVTSASLMTRGPAAAAAAVYAGGRPALSVGLHLDLAEWTFTCGAWVCVYEVAPSDDSSAVAAEIERQLAAFVELLGRNPSHIDSHQHIHRDEPVRSLLLDTAQRLGVPLRHFCPQVAYSGAFYGQSANGAPYPEGISLDGLVATLRGLPAGITELGCHAGYGCDLVSMYRMEREQEVRTLCDPRVRAVLVAEGLMLQSFHRIQDYRA